MIVPTVEETQAVDPGPSLGDRLQRLEEELQLFYGRLQIQDNILKDRQAQAERLKEGLTAIRARADRAAVRLKRSAPRPAPEPIAQEQVQQVEAPAPRRPWHFAAYAVLAATALLLDFQSAPARESPRPAAPPSVLMPAAVRPLPKRDDDSDAALRLVYLFKLPGRKSTVLDVLGAKDDGMGGQDPWDVERLDRDTYLVTFNAAGEGAFHFEVDVNDKTVYVQPDTERRLLAADS